MRMTLEITHAAFVVTGIAGNVAPRIGAGDMPSRLSDDDREFALEVEIVRELWSDDDAGEMPGLAVGKNRPKHGGIFHFQVRPVSLRVRLIVQAYTENLSGLGMTGSQMISAVGGNALPCRLRRVPLITRRPRWRI